MQLSDGRVRPYEGLIPSLSLAELLNSQYLLTVTDSMAATASVDAPLQTPNAAALDAHSLSSYVHGISWFQSLRELMQILSRIVFGCEPESLSALYFILYVAGAGSAATLCEATDGGGQEFRIVVCCNCNPSSLHGRLDFVLALTASPRPPPQTHL